MNMYEFFTRLTHPVKRIGWVETTAYFTGDYRISHRRRGGYYPKMVNTLSTNEFHEYRAFKIAEKLGINPKAVPAHTHWWLFSTYFVREWYGVIYEWTGMEK